MSDVAYALAIGLAATFAWAGVAKLRTPRRTARAFRALGVPATLARVVPVVELALAIAIVVAPVTALVALALLGAFTIVLSRAGDDVTCACFGTATRDPVSWVQLVRNALLMVVAALASLGRPVVPSLAALLTAAGLGTLIVLALALARLKRDVGSVLVLDLP
jgi:hypothetical protein